MSGSHAALCLSCRCRLPALGAANAQLRHASSANQEKARFFFHYCALNTLVSWERLMTVLTLLADMLQHLANQESTCQSLSRMCLVSSRNLGAPPLSYSCCLALRLASSWSRLGPKQRARCATKSMHSGDRIDELASFIGPSIDTLC